MNHKVMLVETYSFEKNSDVFKERQHDTSKGDISQYQTLFIIGGVFPN